ncbi:hypothetical protein [Geminocystis herdmanii]|uniref:hypothetical protein n=1 Tax=Geminocystis herdmanii TaxID=669359 RepID=UPI00034724A8|nr:hypothetical protein [Geminocystis herdmanii]
MNSQLIKTLAQIIQSLSQEERNLLETELNNKKDWHTIKSRIINRSQIIKQQLAQQNQELFIDDIFEQMREERSEDLMNFDFANSIKGGENE